MKTGIYDKLISESTSRELEVLKEDFHFQKNSLDKAESSDILASYTKQVLNKALNRISGDTKISEQINICNSIIRNLSLEVDEDLSEYIISKEAEILLSVIDKVNSQLLIQKNLIRPVTSISENTLFTGAPNEPSLGSELKKEILSADSIDILVSFIRWSGLRIIMKELEDFTKDKKLRVITTSYMGATELKAIEFLSKLPNTEIKISYDNKRTRLHAKSYYFKRESGYSTAYIGSSNISKAAMSSGLEWNMKVSEQSSNHIVEKFRATFDAYWHDSEFKSFDYERDRELLREALSSASKPNDNIDSSAYIFDIKPYSYQREILDLLDAERFVHGNYKNLVVAATGTGKTVISAFDYKKIYGEDNNRLLFIAHREEILKQSLDTYRGVLRDHNFGSLWVGKHRPDQLDHLFVSIQTLNSKELCSLLGEEHFDYIVIDETHHAPAGSYQNLLDHFKPKILLGLTATPERMDEEDVLRYFNDKISAEIRLGQAINRKLLCPFQYFGVSDSVDLSHIKWERRGYSISELTNVYTKNDQRVDLIIKSIHKYISRPEDIKALGFCVSREHAKYMADSFNKAGLASVNLDSNSDDELRKSVKQKLIKGEIKFIFVVDLYNEGVDIPEVNTILFLRPTESLTVFLQQLGRGLRLSDDKECLTVLDFIGQAHKNYNFEGKLRSVIGKTHHSTKEEVINHFPNVPKGCFIELEKTAQDIILKNIQAFTPNKNNLKKKLRNFKLESTLSLNLRNFMEFYHLDLLDLYKTSSFSRLCADVGLIDDVEDRDEKIITTGFKRIIHVDSISLINAWIRILNNFNTYKDSEENYNYEDLISYSELEKTMILMLHYTLFMKSPKEMGMDSHVDIIERVMANKTLSKELLELLNYKKDLIHFIEKDVEISDSCPLKVNARYSRDQLFAGLSDYTFDKKTSRREGVAYIKDIKADVLLVTFNKSDKDFSPTTMYEDYAIDEYLFHWQSQSTTPDTSATGQRYINHRKEGSKVLLFVREYNKTNNIAEPYYFLGKVNYVSHTGSKPMSIIWKLEEPMTQALKSKSSSGVVVG